MSQEDGIEPASCDAGQMTVTYIISRRRLQYGQARNQDFHKGGADEI